MALIRIIIVLLVVTFAGLVWVKPDLLIRLIDPAAEKSKAWLEQRAEQKNTQDTAEKKTTETTIESASERSGKNPVVPDEQPDLPVVEPAIDEDAGSTGFLPGPDIPQEVLIDAPELPGSLREAGFITNHSTKPDIPKVVSVTPENTELSRSQIQAIVGGVEEDIVEVPWLVGLQIYTEIVYQGALATAVEICGGGVYADRWIVTAAHCVEGDYNEIEIIAGSSSLTSDKAVRRVSQRTFIHAGYERDVLREDIALIELSEPLPGFIPIAPWPTDDQALLIPAVTKVTGRGFGVTESGMAAESLKKVELEVQESTLRVIRVADGDGRVQGICQGDSGTPVTGTVDGQTFVVGMVSFTEAVAGANNCSTPGFVAGLVSLEGYIDDIKSLVNLCTAEPAKCDS